MTTATTSYKLMDRKTLQGKLEKKDQFHLWNVLTRDYYRADLNIAGSRWVAANSITEKRAEELVASKGETIVVYCGSQTCPSSKMAAQKLTELGYTNVYAFEGGLKDWTDGGLPTVKL